MITLYEILKFFQYKAKLIKKEKKKKGLYRSQNCIQFDFWHS